MHPQTPAPGETAQWAALLSDAGYRLTEPRLAILQAIAAHPGSFTADDLADEVKNAGVGRATVFRTIEVLTDLEVLHRLHSEGCHTYTVCPPGHHHHLRCSICGRVESIDGCGLETEIARLARETGFAIEDHQLELTGRCAACARA
jgi:Fur family ferric uptake transcriptional regulator